MIFFIFSTAGTASKSEPFKLLIDPGHGGKDLGIVGDDGNLEKEVTLAICKYIREDLKKRDDLDLDIYLTRDSDKDLPYLDRIELAAGLKADIYLSIHAMISSSYELVEPFRIYISKASQLRDPFYKNNDSYRELSVDLATGIKRSILRVDPQVKIKIVESSSIYLNGISGIALVLELIDLKDPDTVLKLHSGADIFLKKLSLTISDSILEFLKSGRYEGSLR